MSRCTYSYIDEELGEIEVLEKVNAAGMSVRVHEGGIVRVTVHPRTSQQEVGKFIAKEKDFIISARKRMAARERKVTYFTPETEFHTARHQLRLTPDSKDTKVHLTVKQGIINVSYPQSVDPAENSVVQELARKGIAFALKVEGEKILPERVSELANRFGFKYSKVELKDLKSRWGSCSNKGVIQLNVQLMRLPQHLIDHVILHELCHTIEMNHGPKFHILLNKVDGGCAAIHENELKKHSTQRF